MFRHKGKNRTLKHNLSIASLLSFVAGLVNVAGFMAVQQLTTNVTGHFAFLIDEVFQLEFKKALTFFFYIFFFFFGSFTSNFIIEFYSRKYKSSPFIIPIFLEICILIGMALFGHMLIEYDANLLAYALLFAMGMQNSLVTTISNSIVRTTHLTGLFTDLGIEMSQWFFYKKEQQRKQLKSSIRLRLTIINFFFLGGIIGGIFYTYLQLHILLIAAFALTAALIYDTIKLKWIAHKRRRRIADSPLSPK